MKKQQRLVPWLLLIFFSAVGDFVNEDEIVAEIETDKVCEMW